MPKPNLQKFIADILEKHARGACTPQEEQFLMDWYDNIGPDDIELDGPSRESIRQRLWSRINPREYKQKRLAWFYKVAAIIVLPIMAAIAFYAIRPSVMRTVAPLNEAVINSIPSHNTMRNDGPEARRITLADGSIVTLQPNSELKYVSVSNDRIREVRLKGEAFFDITPDPKRPFLVYANEVVTKVLGTSFSIRAYEKDEEITVCVKTGRVSVYTNHRELPGSDAQQLDEVILTPNQKVVYDRRKEVVSKQLVEKPEIILPQSDLFAMRFESAPVSEIFDVLAENYGVEIDFDEDLLSNCRLTTSMSDEGLYERIEVICKAIGASYSIQDAVIIIKSKGC